MTTQLPVLQIKSRVLKLTVTDVPHVLTAQLQTSTKAHVWLRLFLQAALTVPNISTNKLTNVKTAHSAKLLINSTLVVNSHKTVDLIQLEELEIIVTNVKHAWMDLSQIRHRLPVWLQDHHA